VLAVLVASEMGAEFLLALQLPLSCPRSSPADSLKMLAHRYSSLDAAQPKGLATPASETIESLRADAPLAP